jgi:hypothetical protein
MKGLRVLPILEAHDLPVHGSENSMVGVGGCTDVFSHI